jgi:hypothetical protein
MASHDNNISINTSNFSSNDLTLSRRRRRQMPSVATNQQSLPDDLKQLTFEKPRDDAQKLSKHHHYYDQDDFSVAQETVTTAASTLDGTYASSIYSTLSSNTGSRVIENSTARIYATPIDSSSHHFRLGAPMETTTIHPAMTSSVLLRDREARSQNTKLQEYDSKPTPVIGLSLASASFNSKASEFSPSILSFGQFSADAIQTQIPDCQVVLLEAEALPTTDDVYKMIESPEMLTLHWMEQIQLVCFAATKYQVRQLIEASRSPQFALPYLCTTTQWSAEWELIHKDDTETVKVALPRLLLMRNDIPCIQSLVELLCNTGRYPAVEKWIPGVLLIVRHMCQIQGLPIVEYQFDYG